MIFTGCNTIDYAPVVQLETNISRLVAEVIEVKQKDSLPVGNVGTNAFGEIPVFADRGIITRAIMEIGDPIGFHMTYGAQLSAMTSPYIEKMYLNSGEYS